MDKRHYEDFFIVPQDYKANMTREAINETLETWLDFYPHTKYVEFLNTLISAINGGTKSIWLTGNYGTGKSNAALVTQKLFMDDEPRVRHWFEECKAAISDSSTLLNNLLTRRNEGTLVVYDYNAAGVGANEDFLVRLERGVVAALNDGHFVVPASSNLDDVVQCLEREKQYFMQYRDEMQSELTYLTSDIKTVEQLITELQKPHKQHDTPTDLLGDVDLVLRKKFSVYLNVSVPTFIKWIGEIIAANNLKRIVYIFDEFHPFIEANKEELKTFEEVVENPSISKFYLVPVSHMLLNAYFGESAKNPKKANDRFHFRNLQMPNDTAFKLAAHAMKGIPETADEWEEEKKNLWEAVRGIAETHFKSEDVSKQSFRDILPIHPMTAFLLKFLSESARSNQRSIFEYLKGSADGHEFQDFIRVGGPGVASKQFLTADYLWKYFMERDDLGQSKDIIAIRAEFERIKSREFQNADTDDEDIRVLKAVLLFCLLSRLNPDGHERLRPTVTNIELTFQGDGAIVGVAGIIKRLAEKHCFSVVNGNIELFATSVGGKELVAKMAEYEPKFHELLSDKTVEELKKFNLKSVISAFSAGRLDVRVSDIGHTTLTNITAATRDKYSSGQNKDTGAICLWFAVAKNKDEQLQIPDKIKGMLTQLRDHRIVMFYFPHHTFCDNNAALWNDYITQYGQYMLENDSTAKDHRKKACERLEKEWFDRIKKYDTAIRVYNIVNGQVVSNDTSWANMKQFVVDYVKRALPYCVDYLTVQTTAFGQIGLQSWAKAGMIFDISQLGTSFAQQKQLINTLAGQGISADENWLTQNFSHPFSQIRTLLDKKITNTVGKGTNLSIRKVYIELQRAPYGLKYNALSAFTLGFVLAHILKRGYQWDNLQKTGALDIDALAEIIESVVKDDGQDKIKGEKLICSLSSQEKAFIEKAPQMFGVTSTIPDARVEDVLLQIQNRIEQISGKVPLWVLPEHIRSTGDSKTETIAEVLNYVCLAGSTSSKSNKTEERTNAIKEVGRIILANSEIVATIANYIKPVNFLMAFQMYVKKSAPTLVSLANELGDADRYCQAILGKAVETAGLLWKETDISAEIDETTKEYEVIKLLTPLAGFTSFVTYKIASDTLRTAITSTNKLPKALIVSALPQLSVFLSSIVNNGAVSDIKDGLELNMDVVKDLFFDASKKMSVELLKQRLPGITIENSDLLNIYNGLSSAFSDNEVTFSDDVRARIENFAKGSVVLKLKENWTFLTDSTSPSVWALDNKIPARYALGKLPEAIDIIAAAETPESFSADKLASLLDVITGLSPVPIADCQARFKLDTIPHRFAKFEISLSSLLNFLEGEHGKQPNNWPTRPDINKFIRDQYKTLAPQVVDKIKKTSADDLKNRLLKLAQENPDLGLLFWE
ncbi:MAG: hypothetical protein AB9844_00820 [Clostridiaceae bacterium]